MPTKKTLFNEKVIISGRVTEGEQKGSDKVGVSGVESEQKESEFVVFSNKIHVSCVHHE